MSKLLVYILAVVSVSFFGCVSRTPMYQDLEISTPVPEDIILDQMIFKFEDESESYGIIGCYTPYRKDMTVEEARQEYIDYALIPWAREIKRELDQEFILFFSHGSTINGQWTCSIVDGKVYSVQEIVIFLKNKYPDMPLILLVCNTGKHTLVGIDVYYSPVNCWITPDSYYPEHIAFERNQESEEEVIGIFKNFIQSE